MSLKSELCGLKKSAIGKHCEHKTQENPIPAVAFYRNKVERIVGFAIYFVFAYFTLAAPLLKA